MPGMEDTRFQASLVFLCAHSNEGAMGLIVNKPTPDVRFGDLLEQLEIEPLGTLPDVRIHYGGPVEQSRGFVLHSADFTSDQATLEVDDDVSMTASRDVLEAIAAGQGPAASMLALGYSGWGPGQLEDEIASNGWLTAPATRDLLFGRAHEYKWAAALKAIGVEPAILSSTTGRA